MEVNLNTDLVAFCFLPLCSYVRKSVLIYNQLAETYSLSIFTCSNLEDGSRGSSETLETRFYLHN
jgi:hypothetical protein